MMRSIPFLALIAATLAIAPLALVPALPGGSAIHSAPVPLDAGYPARRRIGRLTFLGGWALTSQDRRFGGLSALAALGGGRLLALSDTGVASLLQVRPRGVAGRVLGRLPDIGGMGALKRSRDSESLARDPATGRLWAGFETSNLIGRFSAGFARAETWRAPPEMFGWPANGGAESLVRRHDGSFLTFGERAWTGNHAREALLFASDPTQYSPVPPLRFEYRPPRYYDPSDAAELPDGDILVLLRRANIRLGLAAQVALLHASEIRPGALIDARIVARLERPLTVDNMEGIAVEREGGRTIVWLVSDDNFLPVERTLLMKFEWK